MFSSFLTGLSVKISPKKFTQYRNQYVVFQCHVTGNPVPIVSWYKMGTNIVSDSRAKISKIPGGYMMRLGPLHPVFDNNSKVECRAENGVDSPVADKAELHVRTSVFGRFLRVYIYMYTVYTPMFYDITDAHVSLVQYQTSCLGTF